MYLIIPAWYHNNDHTGSSNFSRHIAHDGKSRRASGRVHFRQGTWCSLSSKQSRQWRSQKTHLKGTSTRCCFQATLSSSVAQLKGGHLRMHASVVEKRDLRKSADLTRDRTHSSLTRFPIASKVRRRELRTLQRRGQRPASALDYGLY
ncbi:unnamed protein product, partial [Scytosiphon promiscuus]